VSPAPQRGKFKRAHTPKARDLLNYHSKKGDAGDAASLAKSTSFRLSEYGFFEVKKVREMMFFSIKVDWGKRRR
jgi:hypothetical protein